MLDYYYMNVSCDCSKEQSLALYESLSKDRKEKVDKLKNRMLADKQILIGAFLQHCLSGYVDVSPEELRFEYNEQGKPFINGDIHFNMSHSGDYVVLVVSDHPVGIDIERIRPDRLSIAKRCFCEEEYQDIINAGDKEEQDRRFIEYWTLKEAYVKYIGKGLSMPFDSFRIIRADKVKFIMDEGGQLQRNEIVCAYSRFLQEKYCVSICYEKDALLQNKDILNNGNNIEIAHLS